MTKIKCKQGPMEQTPSTPTKTSWNKSFKLHRRSPLLLLLLVLALFHCSRSYWGCLKLRRWMKKRRTMTMMLVMISGPHHLVVRFRSLLRRYLRLVLRNPWVFFFLISFVGSLWWELEILMGERVNWWNVTRFASVNCGVFNFYAR